MKIKRLFLFSLGCVAILFFLLIQWAGIREIAVAFMSINPLYIPLILFLPFAMMFVYTLRWNILLESVGIKTSLRTVLKYAFIGAALNNITPVARFGGEPIKCYMLSEDIGVKKRRALASITMDSFITAISLLVLIYFGAMGLLIFNVLDLFAVVLILSVILLPLLIGSYIFYNKGLLSAFVMKISKMISRLSPGYAKNLPDVVMTFRDNIRTSVKKRNAILNSLLLGLLERGIEVLGLYVIFMSMGINLSFYACAMVLGVGVIFGLIPLLPGGLVVYESSTIIFLGFLGVGPALAASSIMLWRGLTYWMMTGIGLILMWLRGAKLAFEDVKQFAIK